MRGVIEVVFTRLEKSARAPFQKHEGDAGYDLACSRDTVVPPWGRTMIPTGLAVQFPYGFWGRLTGRSSTLGKHNLLVIDGVIDEGYRGELFLQAFNLTPSPFTVAEGMRIGQLILHQIIKADWVEAEDLRGSSRGKAGFGSTGVDDDRSS